MSAISSYHRPTTLDEALALLNRHDVATRVLGGGTVLAAARAPDTFEVVDLQALDLGGIEAGDQSVVIGATARLQDVVDDPSVPGLVREMAHREAPNTIRNAATIGGAVAQADFESELLAALLVHEAVVTVNGPGGDTELPLSGLLTDPSTLRGAVVTSVIVQREGATASHRTGRTPADRPIVCVAGRRHQGRLWLAATGVAATPVLVERDRLDDLEPPGDFRGSPEYRRRLAKVLASRVVSELEGVTA